MISKFGLNNHESQIFFLAPTSARPVLVEHFSGRFSYFRINFNIHYLPFSVNCTFQTYTVQHLPFQSCNHNENTICTWQKDENDTQDIGKEKEETSFAVVEITFLANTKSCNVERHSSLKVHNLFCLGQTLANINMGDIEDCIQQGQLALQNLKKKW